MQHRRALSLPAGHARDIEADGGGRSRIGRGILQKLVRQIALIGRSELLEPNLQTTLTPSGEATVRVSVSVHNDGPAIPLAVRDKLFTPFARGNQGENSGVGLGLFIVHEIASAHGDA